MRVVVVVVTQPEPKYIASKCRCLNKLTGSVWKCILEIYLLEYRCAVSFALFRRLIVKWQFVYGWEERRLQQVWLIRLASNWYAEAHVILFFICIIFGKYSLNSVSCNLIFSIIFSAIIYHMHVHNLWVLSNETVGSKRQTI